MKKPQQSTLSEWSDIIARLGDQRRAEQDEYNKTMEAGMPDAVDALPARTNEELVELLLQFFGGRVDPRETELRAEFHNAVKAEILRRMEKAQ